MQEIYTLSAFETGAADFFQAILAQKTELVLDIRFQAQSQLCGFTKEKDLQFFIPKLTGAQYVHDVDFAPTKELLARYTKLHIGWETYREEYAALLEQRQALALYKKRYGNFSRVCLLGTQTKKRRSHSEVLYDFLCSDVLSE